jgi:hypothetical protein
VKLFFNFFLFHDEDPVLLKLDQGLFSYFWLTPDPDLDPVFFMSNNCKLTFEKNHTGMVPYLFDKKCYCTFIGTIYAFLDPTMVPYRTSKKSLRLHYDKISPFSFLLLALLDLYPDSVRFLIFVLFESGSIPDPYKI